MPTPATRPRTIAQLRDALARLHTDQSVERALEFRPRPSDVFVATYPKCGTTWMQQIVHGLRTGGAMDFDEISDVVPWLEAASDLGIDPDADPLHPRAFKTHFHWAQVPKGARYIYITRDPCDVLVSFFHFFEGWMFEPGAISLATFADAFFFEGSRSGRYWDHLRGWWPQRDEQSVLMLSYERMQRELAAVVAEVAAFLAADPANVQIATQQASFSFMREHGQQFDDHRLRELRDPHCGLPPGTTSKLRTGRVGDAQDRLSPELRERFAAVWREEITATLGFADYAALEAAIPQSSSGPNRAR